MCARMPANGKKDRSSTCSGSMHSTAGLIYNVFGLHQYHQHDEAQCTWCIEIGEDTCDLSGWLSLCTTGPLFPPYMYRHFQLICKGRPTYIKGTHRAEQQVFGKTLYQYPYDFNEALIGLHTTRKFFLIHVCTS